MEYGAYVGIDPGLRGAIAVLGKKSIVEVFDMPTSSYKRRKIVDVQELKNIFSGILERHGNCFCALERQWARTMQGVSSTFSIGHQLGIIEGLLCGLGLEYELIVPYVWQSYYGIWGKSLKRREIKNLSYDVSSRIFPTVQLKTDRNRILDGRCDALLMAFWGAHNVDKKR